MEMSQNSDQVFRKHSFLLENSIKLEWRQHWIEVMTRSGGTWATFFFIKAKDKNRG